MASISVERARLMEDLTLAHTNPDVHGVNHLYPTSYDGCIASGDMNTIVFILVCGTCVVHRDFTLVCSVSSEL